MLAGCGCGAQVFDPLDGSSNIDCNIPVGTIFGMYKEKVLILPYRFSPAGSCCREAGGQGVCGLTFASVCVWCRRRWTTAS